MGDPTSFANIEDLVQKKIHFDLGVDFDTKVLTGHVDITFEVLRDNIRSVTLDTSGLTIKSVVELPMSHLKALVKCHNFFDQWSIGQQHGEKGAPLSIELLSVPKKGASLNLRIAYETSKDASGLQWLTPGQTAGKKHPYLFTQLEAIHARSMFPCQDSCAAKFTYSAAITVPEYLIALMGAKRLGEVPSSVKGKKTFKFDQPIAIASYLLALAVGDIVSRDIGPRSKVWTEPSVVDAAAWEFSGDTEKFLAAAESILGPYVWGNYDILLMPPSFPYGGMENPMLTFATPTLLAGDKSNNSTIAHEIVHSWCGNLVTNKTWEHFWLNEGFTVFNERKVLGKVFGSHFQHMHAALGHPILCAECERIGLNSNFTCLIWNDRVVVTEECSLEKHHPDEAFSRVPYEKGFYFLWHLEQLVGGPDIFEPFQRKWIEKHKYGVATSSDFQSFFSANFPEAKVEWDVWFNTPGLPKWENKYDDTLVKEYTQLAQKWLSASEADILSDLFSENDVKEGFLGILVDTKKVYSAAALEKMQSLYKFGNSKNFDVLFWWLRLCINSEYEQALEPCIAMLRAQGRMKFTRPLYRALFASKMGKEKAVETFQTNRHFYHPICDTMVAKDLGLA